MSTNSFLHDANARTDEKILHLRAKHGWEGYGLYWAIIELMREATDYKLRTDAVDVLVLGLGGIDSTKLSAVIATALSVRLFEEEAGHFFSRSLIRRMEKLQQISNIRRKAVEARWTKNKRLREDVSYTNVLHDPPGCINKPNKTKRNRKKQNESILGGECERGGVPLADGVRVSETEHAKLLTEFGADVIAHYAPICADWLKANGQRKKDYAAFLRNWIRKDRIESKGFFAAKTNSKREQTVLALKAKFS